MSKEIKKIRIPFGWSLAKLNDITIPIERTNRKHENAENKFKYIDIESIDNHLQKIHKVKQLTWGQAPSRAQQIVEGNDILFATVRPYLKNIAVVTQDLNSEIASSGFCVLRVREINFKYVYYNIISDEFINRINKFAKGTSYPAVTNQIVLDQTIPIPPLAEQNEIVSLLDELLSELEKGKDQLSKALEQLHAYRQSILKNAFEGILTESWRGMQIEIGSVEDLMDEINFYRTQRTDAGYDQRETFTSLPNAKLSKLNELPSTWFWTQLGEISDSIEYGYTESSTREPIGPKFLRITDIQENFVDWDTVPYCKISEDKKKKYLLNDGDLVFARTGATVGKSYLIRENPPEAVFASYLIRVRLIETISHEFIYYFFQSEFYWRQITEGQNGTGQPNVNGSKLSELFLPLTSKKEQEEIVKILGSIMSKCDNLEGVINKSINEIDDVKQVILKNAFEGRLTKQVSNKEHAKVLLEKIKITKELILNQKKEKGNKTKPLKNKKMAEELMEIIDILKESGKAIPTKEVWQSSIQKDNIDEFYAKLKEHIEAGEIDEIAREGKESFLKLTSQDENR